MCVGADLEPSCLGIEGIFKNPLWVIDGRYGGMAMALPSISGAVFTKYLQEPSTAKSKKKAKENWLKITPYGSMQVILSKSLKPGDGVYDGFKDITNVKVSPDAGVYGKNRIKVSALNRIFKEMLEK